METNLFETLLEPNVIALAAAIVALLYGLGKIPLPHGTLGECWQWRKVLPVIPLVLGVAGAFLVIDTENTGTSHPVLLGLWAGFVAAHGRKVFKRLVVDRQDKE